jgi:hypothetical protein
MDLLLRALNKPLTAMRERRAALGSLTVPLFIGGPDDGDFAEETPAAPAGRADGTPGRAHTRARACHTGLLNATTLGAREAQSLAASILQLPRLERDCELIEALSMRCNEMAAQLTALLEEAVNARETDDVAACLTAIDAFRALIEQLQSQSTPVETATAENAQAHAAGVCNLLD